jgi:signal transduction histidine kinase
MDIRIAFTRAGLFIAVYTLVLGFPFAIGGTFKNKLLEVFGPNWWILPLSLMAALATTGPYIYIYLQRKAEERLLREQRRYQDTLKQAAIGMTRIRSLTRLLSLISHIVTKTVKISFASIYLFDEQNNEYILQVNRGIRRIPKFKFSAEQPLISRLLSNHQPLVYEEVKRQMQDSGDSEFIALEADMRILAASVVVPSFLDNKLTGFIVLGDKISGQFYTPDDLNVFQVLASQAALAIENAQFYEEAKEMQAQIAQAEKMATVGTMADGLSHQINNRFYALSLIAGDTIDTIKMTDTSNCSPEIQEMIKQISSALERIQANVMQGGEVVKGILKYTRKGEEGMEALTMDQIIDGTLEMVKYKVKLQEIDLIRDYPQDTPKIKANQVQMQEVFFNLIDNGYDAIVERRNTLKEPDYRGKITFSVKTKDNILEITVQDNGMGVKQDDIKKIFTPFFTTKASSRKGTGLGLYVIRNIITETHKGKISFHSEHKVGTRFTLELPIAQ